MATITLYASKVNQMPGLIKNVKRSVTDYKSELSKLRKKTLSVDKKVCNMDDILSQVQSSTQTQDQKIQLLDKVSKDSEEFITDTARIDSNVADVVNKRKDDFYEKYYYLKPECEKSGWEKFKDGCKKVGEWCKAHWKAIITVIAVIAAIVVIVFFPGVSVLLLFAAKGLVSGAIIGGLVGGLQSIGNGGSFWEGVENGAFSGALWGAAFGLVGGAGFLSLGKLAGCKGLIGLMGGCPRAMQLIATTARVSGKIAFSMFGFDVVSLAIKVFDPNNPVVVLNQTLHQNSFYNGAQFAVSFLAAFSGGAATRLKDGFQICFVAGTMVLTANGLVAIEDIKEGDKVIATDPDNFQTEEKRVVKTYINKTAQLVKIFIHNEVVMTTINHPFYVHKLGFVPANRLCIGDEIVNAHGSYYKVQGIKVVDKQETVYNFQVEDLHTYFVGESHLLVHNGCGDTYPESSIEQLSNTEKFTDSAIEHIFEGQVNGRGKAVGYHYEGIEGSAGKVIPGSELPANSTGVYMAKVEVNGIAKTANGGFSTFFSKGMSPQEVVNAINEAYANKTFVFGSRNTYQGVSKSGIIINMFLDAKGKIISAFPER